MPPPGPAPVIKKIQATIDGRVEKSTPRTPQKQKLGQKLTGPSPSKFLTPKHGWCPKCEFGHRVLGRFNPEGGSLYAGRKRYVCSNAGEDGCDYWELVKEDAVLATAATPVKDGSICPQCKKGRLVVKTENPFNFKERYLECDRKRAPERPCNYRENIGKPKQAPETPNPPVPLFETPSKQTAIPCNYPNTPQHEQNPPPGQPKAHQREAVTPQQALGGHQVQAAIPETGIQTPSNRHGYQPAMRSNTPPRRPAEPSVPDVLMSTQAAGVPGSANPAGTVVSLSQIPYMMRTPTGQLRASTNTGLAGSLQAPGAVANLEANTRPPNTIPLTASFANRQPNFCAPQDASSTVIDLTDDDAPITPTRSANPVTPVKANSTQARRALPVTPTIPHRTPSRPIQSRLSSMRAREPSVDYDEGLSDKDMLELSIKVEMQLQQAQQQAQQQRQIQLSRRQPPFGQRDEYGHNSDDDAELVSLADQVALQTPQTTPLPSSRQFQRPVAAPLTPTRVPANFVPRQSQHGPPAFGPRRRVQRFDLD